MKRLIIVYISIFISGYVSGQEYLKIDYPGITDTTIQHSTISNVEFYSVSFYNSKHQIIKTSEKVYNDNHKVSWEKRFYKYKTYYYYQGALLEKSISFDFIANKLSKTSYVYNVAGRKIEVNDSLNQNLPKEAVLKFANSDYYLNNPDQITKGGWVVNGKEKRQYANDSLITGINYFSYDEKVKQLIPGRKEIFLYNSQKNLLNICHLPTINRRVILNKLLITIVKEKYLK